MVSACGVCVCVCVDRVYYIDSGQILGAGLWKHSNELSIYTNIKEFIEQLSDY